MVAEPEPIRGQLTDNPYIFIPEPKVWFRQGNLHHMKTMIENGKQWQESFLSRILVLLPNKVLIHWAQPVLT
jgi:hypothetical protein